jgi:hypothetical protein
MATVKLETGGVFQPSIWADKFVEEYKSQLVMDQMQKAFDWQPRGTCPLSKQIIMDDIQELIAMQPDKHMIEILQDIGSASDGAERSDIPLAEIVNQLVCSLRSACKNDSSSES